MRRYSILGAAILLACSAPAERLEQASASASAGIGPPDDDDDGASSDDEGDDEDAGDTGDRLDVAGGESGSDDACPDSEGGGAGGIHAGEFSYIWIANSYEGTVSKIDTKDGAELGRYRTAPGSTPNPSRTSVNLYGDVAVMNRQVPSVTKIAAREADCLGASTSTGPDDIKPWGEDACVLWHTELGASGLYEDGPRPVAWEGGTDGGCTKNPRLWVGWGDMAAATGTFQRLDGATGEVLDEVVVTNWETSVAPIGPYGGAVSRDGSFWIAGLGGPLVHIDGTTLDVTYLPRPANSYFYGIALDAAGNPWLGDLAGVTWTYFIGAQTFRQNAMAGARGRGIAVDREAACGCRCTRTRTPSPARAASRRSTASPVSFSATSYCRAAWSRSASPSTSTSTVRSGSPTRAPRRPSRSIPTPASSCSRSAASCSPTRTRT